MDNKARKREEVLREVLLDIFWTDTIGKYHVDEAVEALLRCPKDAVGPILEQVRLMVFTVSDMLAFHFIEHAHAALEYISPKDLAQWVRDALEIYEAEGLAPAVDFFANPAYTTAPIRSSRRLPTLDEQRSRLRFLIGGLLGHDIELTAGAYPHTDGRIIAVPPVFDCPAAAEDGPLLYKMAVVHKCMQLKHKSFRPLWASGIQEMAPDRVTLELYCLLDTVRIESIMKDRYPGLWRELTALKARILSATFDPKRLTKLERSHMPLTSNAKAVALVIWIANGLSPPAPWQDLALMADDAMNQEAILEKAMELAAACTLDETFLRLKTRLLPYVGTMTLEAAQRVRNAHEERLSEGLVTAFSAILLELPPGERENRVKQLLEELQRMEAVGGVDGQEVTALLHSMLGNARKDDRRNQTSSAVTMEGSLPEAVLNAARLLEEMEEDFGQIPLEQVSAAFGVASRLYCPDIDVPCHDIPKNQEFLDSNLERAWRFFHYDEWDFRRERFRKNWCTIKEMALAPAGGTFCEDTLRRHRGQLALLRRQFEFIRQDYRYLRRQKDGELIDLDATVEAFVDLRVSGSASDHLFIRQVRDRRDLVVAFLVDMSASTEGWIGRAIKESLILLCEALETLGDRYGIFGFSGMRRTGCQFFRIKEFDHPYDREVRQRINAIGPRDYTRMGAAVRHATRLLADQEARIRLLMLISDGKPEDYDEYKGHYAVEDTRMSVIAAREQGVSPFCITIDREARSYLPRIFGQTGYVVVEDPARLHRRIPEMYRLLTT